MTLFLWIQKKNLARGETHFFWKKNEKNWRGESKKKKRRKADSSAPLTIFFLYLHRFPSRLSPLSPSLKSLDSISCLPRRPPKLLSFSLGFFLSPFLSTLPMPPKLLGHLLVFFSFPSRPFCILLRYFPNFHSSSSCTLSVMSYHRRFAYSPIIINRYPTASLLPPSLFLFPSLFSSLFFSSFCVDFLVSSFHLFSPQNKWERFL